MNDNLPVERVSDEGAATRRRRLLLPVALVGGLLLRLGTWPQVFAEGRVWIDGPDGYYHLRRAWLTLQNWPRAPQTDMLIGVPEGGPISWPPVFDVLLATLALPWRGSTEASLEIIGVLLPPVLGALEILVLFLLVRRLFGAQAAGWAALFAAVLPGVSRYSLLGALDHDPLIETLAMVALYGLAGGLKRAGASWRDAVWVALGLMLLVLTWAGSILHLGMLCVVVLALEWNARRSGRAPATAAALGFGGLMAAAATLPFVAGSVWTERLAATFIGLSWLHTAALLGVATFGLTIWVSSRSTRWTLIALCASAAGLLSLLGVAWPAFRDGLTFFARGEPFLQGVMESRPLLSLFGSFDLRTPIIRLSLLPLLIPVLLPWMARRGGSGRRLTFLWVWLLSMLSIALVQSRYAHAAALPVAALAGVLMSELTIPRPSGRKRVFAALLLVVVVGPSLPAYLTVAGFEPFRFYGRTPKIQTTGFAEACDFFRQEIGPSESWGDHETASNSAVLAPWSAGHWLIWKGRQGTVTTPLGPQGQPAFVNGIRFYLESSPQAIRELLDRHRVRYVVVTAQVPPLDAYVGLAGDDPAAVFAVDRGPGPWPLDAGKYLSTAAARLTWIGPQQVELFGRELAALDDFEEIFRSRQTRPNPFARALPAGSATTVPLLRIFEVRAAGERAALEISRDPIEAP